MRSVKTRLNSWLSLLTAIVILGAYTATPVYAISQEQINLYKQGILLFDIEKCSAAANSQLSGSDNPEKIWNYFKTQGLEDIHIAAIMGNIQQESSFNPTIIQTASDGSGGGSSEDPNDSGNLGWGLSQWTPGSKVITVAAKYNITGAIYELSTQLSIIWEELNDVTPAGYPDFISDFTKITTLEDAVEFYTVKYEAAGEAALTNRISFAQQALAQYGNNTGTSTDSSGQTTAISSGSAGCATTASYISPDCEAAVGNAKILCAAKAYDTASYRMAWLSGHQGGAKWHATCPVIGPSCYLDCSGLVNIALYDASNGRVDMGSVVADYPNLTDLWEEISFEELQSGDVLTRISYKDYSDHVVIVDYVEGNNVHVFAANQPSSDQTKQVSSGIADPTTYNHYYRYIGPGL